jgi:hypothetical protein
MAQVGREPKFIKGCFSKQQSAAAAAAAAASRSQLLDLQNVQVIPAFSFSDEISLKR